MTERRSVEPFERQLADRVRTYTDVATARRIDAVGVARTAMSFQPATAWSVGWLGAGLLGRRIAGVRWAIAVMAVVLIGVVAVTVQRRRRSGRSSSRSASSSSPPSPVTSSGVT